jgi:hypothetical protein
MKKPGGFPAPPATSPATSPTTLSRTIKPQLEEPKDNITEGTETITLSLIDKKLNIPGRISHWCQRPNEIEHLDFLLDNITNSREIERFAIKTRYITILRNTASRSRLYSRFYHGGHFIVTVGSLIVPALLSIQFTSTNSMSQSQFQEIIYWTTWVLSLMVTIANGILTLFKVDKKYNLLQIMLQKLKSEGYQFVSLTGRYSIKSNSSNSSNPYDTQLNVFSYQVEKIIQKQIDDEYYKTPDGISHVTGVSGKTSGSGAIDEKHAYTIQEPTENVQEKDAQTIENAVKKYIRSSNLTEETRPNVPQDDIETGIKKTAPIVLSLSSKRNQIIY